MIFLAKAWDGMKFRGIISFYPIGNSGLFQFIGATNIDFKPVKK